jgi:hypothetical protein
MTTIWDSTPEGSAVDSAYLEVQQLYNNKLPAHKQSLWNLSKRQIKG